MNEASRHQVLVVDDDPQVRELFESLLEDSYEVRVAESGQTALKAISEAVDVVLLDRRMPGLSGTETLREIRAEGYDCRVAMVTAVEPDLDIIQMGFDDYVVKPVSRSKLHNVVDSLLHWEAYDSVLKRYFNVARKVAVLESEQSRETLDRSDEYHGLLAALDSLQQEADDSIDSLPSAEFESFTSRIELPFDDSLEEER